MQSATWYKLGLILCTLGTMLVGTAEAAPMAAHQQALDRGSLWPSLSLMVARLAPRGQHPNARTSQASPQNGMVQHGITTTERTAHRPGVVGGLASGFLGAGLLGILFGNGFFSGVGSVTALIGLALQFGVILLVLRLARSWWRQRPSPAFVGLSPRQLADAYDRPRSDLGAGHEPCPLTEADYDTFEHLLGEIRTAYGRGDMAALQARVTPDLLATMADELAGDASRGVVNELGGAHLLQGSLVTAWRDEAGADHATVRLRFVSRDRMVERENRRLLAGGTETETTELWSFVRQPGSSWLLASSEAS